MAIAGFALLLGISSATAATLPTGFEERTVASGLTAPTAVAWAPDGRMFVAEKGGRVRVVTAAGALVSKPVIDISDHVNTNGDRGLLGLAVDSSFASNGFMYLLYTYDTRASASDQPKSSRLTRVTVKPDNTAAGETVLLGSHPTQPCPIPSNTIDCIPSDGGSHSIGTVRSAADGTLWVGSGDGAGYGGVDPVAVRTHNEESFSGKLIHIDRNGRGLPGHPFCPAVADLGQVCTKVWAKGFRNPFRFTIRPNGLPVVGDVGWGSWEELDLAQPGRNYGWPCYEGNSKVGGYSSQPTCKEFYTKEGTTAGITFPDHLYAHGSGSSIIGGPTYTGGPYPDDFDGDIIFGDYVQGFIKRLELDAQGKVTGTTAFATDWFGVDIELWNGELYYVNFGDGGSGSGSVVRIVYSPNNSTPIAVAAATPTFGASPLKVTFKGGGSSDPDGDPLKYEWDFGDGTAKSTAKDPPVHTYKKGGNFDARLKVTDSKNASATTTVRISVNNAPPAITLGAPLDGAKYRNGVPVQFSGSATDPDDGALADSRLSWNVVLVHGSHVHPFQSMSGKTGSFTPTPDHDADSFYRVTLTATDSDALSTSKTVVIRPQVVNLSIASTPAAGAPINYAGYPLVAPHKAQAAIGFRTSVSTAQRFVANGRAYEFTGWSDGGAIAHDVTIPATDVDLVARYRDAGPVVKTVGGFGPGPDKLGPRILFRGAKARRLTGNVSDVSGVKDLKVALRSRARGGCRWWSSKTGRLARKRTGCKGPRWMKAVLREAGSGTWTWTVKLGGRLPQGRYKLAFRATDGAGNVSTALAAGRPSITR